jgi:hypothetical protein
VRRACQSGEIKWQDRFVYVHQVLAGEPIGLSQIDEHLWRVYYGALELGRLDARTTRIEPKTENSVTHVPG